MRQITLKKAEMCVALAWHIDQPTAMAADIILPGAEAFEEDPCFVSNAAGAWSYAAKIVKWPGEVRSAMWILVHLAKKLGVSDKFAELLGVDDEREWGRVMEQAARKAYEERTTKTKYNVPWEEFLKNPIYRMPLEKPAASYQSQIEKCERFYTASGKIEFCSEYLAKTDLKRTKYGGYISPIRNICPSKGGVL
ncbi:MAG: molybdopterin-dependent oxidoreductase [Nitrososphaeria archaeon]